MGLGLELLGHRALVGLERVGHLVRVRARVRVRVRARARVRIRVRVRVKTEQVGHPRRDAG